MLPLMKSIQSSHYSCAVGFDQFEVPWSHYPSTIWLILSSPQWALESLWKQFSGHVCGGLYRWGYLWFQDWSWMWAAPRQGRHPEMNEKETKEVRRGTAKVILCEHNGTSWLKFWLPGLLYYGLYPWTLSQSNPSAPKVLSSGSCA